MRMYLSLLISSETDNNLGATIATRLGLISRDVTDNECPERVKRISRRHTKIASLSHLVLPRFVWSLSSKGAIESNRLVEHLNWIFADMKPGCLLCDITIGGKYDAWLSCFWESSGHGGGPSVDAEVSNLLAKNGLPLRFDFYCVDE